MQELIQTFREKLEDDRRTLKWWHGKYVGKLYKYNYFIRQINTPDSIKDDLKEIISTYIFYIDSI